jgi:hypothetical protein
VIQDFLIALGVTVLVEGCALALASGIFRLVPFSRAGAGRIALTAIACSAATLPYVWFVFPALVPPGVVYYLVAEPFAAVVEGFMMVPLLRVRLRTGLLVSLFCNCVSFGAGFALGLS